MWAKYELNGELPPTLVDMVLQQIKLIINK